MYVLPVLILLRARIPRIDLDRAKLMKLIRGY
jgi:hypothetical protein